MQSKAETVPAYLAELAPAGRKALSVLRKKIKAAAPKAKEHMAYGMPTWSADGTMLFALASQKQYLALYVCDLDAVDKYKGKLGATSIGKSCIRFRSLEQLDLAAVEALLREAARSR